MQGTYIIIPSSGLMLQVQIFNLEFQWDLVDSQFLPTPVQPPLVKGGPELSTSKLRCPTQISTEYVRDIIKKR